MTLDGEQSSRKSLFDHISRRKAHVEWKVKLSGFPASSSQYFHAFQGGEILDWFRKNNIDIEILKIQKCIRGIINVLETK